MAPGENSGITELYEIDPVTGERQLVDRFPQPLSFDDVMALATAQALCQVERLVVEDVLAG